MKLQSFGVIFTLIVIPLILVLSYYIQLQVDTITLQNEYDSKLLDATYDAMSSFELNTANEDLSTVSDSLRTIIEASSNIFISTLATNLGMSNASKSYVEPYIPALLYTMYDGYYIYAPTKVPTVLVDSDGNAVAVGDPGVKPTGGKNEYTYTEVAYTDDPNLSPVENQDNKTKLENDNRFSSYSDLQADSKNDFGQLLYLKKGTTNTYTTMVYKDNGEDNVTLKTKNVLKTYIPYSAKYSGTSGGKNVDISVVYTLDNYVTIEGTIGKEYYTKSGYLIPGDLTKTDNFTEDYLDVKIDGKSFDFLTNYNQNDAERTLQRIINQDYEYVTVTLKKNGTTFDAGKTATGKPVKLDEYETDIAALENQEKKVQEYLASIRHNTFEGDTLTDEKYTNDMQVLLDVLNTTLHNRTNTYTITSFERTNAVAAPILKDLLVAITKEKNDRQYEIDKISAAVYYAKAKIFSEWVYANLGEIEENNLIEISGREYRSINGTTEVIHDFSQSTNKIFDITGSESEGDLEIAVDSPFYTHKMNVIRNSIQYNLNLTMSTYNKNEIYTFDYEMPVIADDEWEQILSKVSIVSFMQGVSCGLKKYNNYMIVTSSNNEVTVSPDDIYYIEKDKFNDELTEYHKVNCSIIRDETADDTEYLAFNSKDVKYDKIYDKTSNLYPYKYDHKNVACYKCVNDRNYNDVDIFDTSITDYDKYDSLRRAFYIGVGKERNDIYKMNAVRLSEGYEIIYDYSAIEDGFGDVKTINNISSLGLDKIRAIEIVLDTIHTTDRNETSLTYEVYNGSVTKPLNNSQYTVPSNSSSEYTILVEVDPNITPSLGPSKIGKTSLYFKNVNDLSTAEYDPSDVGIETEFEPKNNDIVQKAIKYIRVIYK